MKNLKEIRKRKGLTQDLLAAKSGVRQATISDIERGKIENPGIATARRLAAALEVTLDDLFVNDELVA